MRTLQTSRLARAVLWLHAEAMSGVLLSEPSNVAVFSKEEDEGLQNYCERTWVGMKPNVSQPVQLAQR